MSEGSRAGRWGAATGLAGSFCTVAPSPCPPPPVAQRQWPQGETSGSWLRSGCHDMLLFVFRACCLACCIRERGWYFRNLPTQRHCRLYRSILVFRGGCYHCGDKYSKRILRCISALLMHLYFSSYQHKRRRTKNKSRNLVFGEGFLPRSVCCCLSSNKLYKEYRTTLYIHGHTCSHVSSFRYYIYKSNAQLNARNIALGGGGIRETEASSQFATLHRARRACVLERSAARPHGRTDGLIFKTDRLSAGSPSDRSESRSDQTEYGPVFTWGGLADKVRWVLLQGTPL